jgi:hypothetical protein
MVLKRSVVSIRKHLLLFTEEFYCIGTRAAGQLEDLQRIGLFVSLMTAKWAKRKEQQKATAFQLSKTNPAINTIPSTIQQKAYPFILYTIFRQISLAVNPIPSTHPE